MDPTTCNKANTQVQVQNRRDDYNAYFVVSDALLAHEQLCKDINTKIEEMFPYNQNIENMLSEHRSYVASALIKATNEPHEYLELLPNVEAIVEPTHFNEYKASIKKTLDAIKVSMKKLVSALHGPDVNVSPYNKNDECLFALET